MDLDSIVICCGLIVALYVVLFVTASSLHRERPGEVMPDDNVQEH